MPKPCAQPIGCAAAPLEQLVGPGHRARAWRHRRSGTGRRRRPAPRSVAGRHQPEDEPEGDHLVPDDRRRDRPASRWRAVTVQAHQPTASAPSERSAPRTPSSSSGAATSVRRARPSSVPTVPGREGDRPLPKPSAIRCAGWREQEAPAGTAAGAGERRCSAGSAAVIVASAQARKWSNEPNCAGDRPRRRASTRRRPAPASIRPMRVTGDAGARAARQRRRRGATPAQ